MDGFLLRFKHISYSSLLLLVALPLWAQQSDQQSSQVLGANPIDPKALLQAIPAGSDLQKNLDTINGYYGKIQQKLPATAQPASKAKPAQTPSTEQTGGANQGRQLGPSYSTVTPKPRYSNQRRDPFAVTETMIMRSESLASGNFVPSLNQAERLPHIELKGIVVRPDGLRAALIRVDNRRTYVVKEADTIGLNERGPGNALYVRKIDDLSLEVEVGRLGHKIIVR